MIVTDKTNNKAPTDLHAAAEYDMYDDLSSDDIQGCNSALTSPCQSSRPGQRPRRRPLASQL